MSREQCTITVDGRTLQATAGQSLAVALLQGGHLRFRESCSGQGRAPLCGMGTCYECRVRVADRWVRACVEPVRDNMEVRTHE
jgi:D-hydroxyproline dehydrogenase subunit gamma